jgi:DNA modification methylase
MNEIICGDSIKVMAEMPENSIDTIVTDPPYGLEFMGKDWDSFKGINSGRGREENELTAISRGPEKYEAGEPFQEFTHNWAKEALRVAKPGAMMLCFGGTRTAHRAAVGIEDAGWEIRDTLMWLYGSGFPKSLNIGKAIDKKLGKLETQSGGFNTAGGKYGSIKAKQSNTHPTVKPLKLMRYLVKLTKTPTGGIVLDPFVGSGTTAMAAKLEGRQYIGIDMSSEYCEIARARVASVKEPMV